MITFDYNGFSLQNNWITTSSSDILSSPQRNVQVDKLAHMDGGRVVQQPFDSRTFHLTGTIYGANIEDMQAKVDAFKAAVSQPNGTLTFQVDTAPGRIVYCTPQQVSITNENGYATADFNVSFISPDGMKWAKQTSTLISAPFLASTVQPSITVEGSYKAQPDITVTYNALAGGPGTVSVSNGMTLQGIIISRTWAKGDVLEVDCLNQLIYVNNIATDFTGQFPSWNPGTGFIRYVDTFASRNATMTATYTKRWL